MEMGREREILEIKGDNVNCEEECNDEIEDTIKRVAPWTKQMTLRGVIAIASVVAGMVYCVIAMKLVLTTGTLPNLNVSAALLAFVFLRSWTKLLHRLGITTAPFTRQENATVQTCVVACYSIAVGGFIPTALIMCDGIYNFIKIQFLIIRSFLERMKNKNLSTEEQEQILDDLQRNELFLRERIPIWLACVGYIFSSVISIVVIPLMFSEMKWYYVVVAYLLPPPLGFCNAYIHGAGLTDLNMAYNYGKVALFVIAAIAGTDSGVVAGLVGCGLIKSTVLISSDLIHDFKMGQLTLTSPRSMLLSQAIGTAIGCVVAPPIFFLFYKAFDIGNPDGEYKAPYALIYRNMAILGVEGFSALPQYCLQLCYAFFGFAVIANLVRDFAPKRIGKWVPLPMAMAVPFLVGASFAIDMCVGSLVVFIWHKINREDAKLMVPVIASGLICEEGLWILPSSILALAKFEPPICMMFSKPSR